MLRSSKNLVSLVHTPGYLKALGLIPSSAYSESPQDHEIPWERFKQKAPKKLCVLLHGYGANAGDLLSLVPGFETSFAEKITWISLEGPIRLNTTSRAWFPLGFPLSMDLIEIDDATQMVKSALNILWAEGPWSLQNTVLLGFSQGGAMALQAGRFGAFCLAGLICLSGFDLTLMARQMAQQKVQIDYQNASFFFRNTHKDIQAFGKRISTHLPPTVWIHGQRDTIVPWKIQQVAQAYEPHWADYVSIPDLDHGINPSVMQATQKHLEQMLNLSL